MWCQQCRQDVPGVPSDSGKLRCLRCGTLVRGEALDDTAVGVATGVSAMADCGLELGEAAPMTSKPSMDFDDWDLDPDMRSFRNARKKNRLAEFPEPLAAHRYDAPHANNMPWNGATTMPPGFVPQGSMPQWSPQQPMPMPPARQEGARRASWMAWFVMSLGLMAFCCGGVLLGWSYMANRTELWNLGVPLAVAGQIALLVGLVLQLERVWQNNRYAVEKLDEVDERLADIRHSQTLLRVNHSSAAQAFYTHMAEGAAPSMLLADLKGQLDLLAVRLSERR